MKKIIFPLQLDDNFKNKIEKQYGPINLEKDFFSGDLSTYFKISDDGQTHDVIKLLNFKLSISLFKDVIAELKKLEKSINDNKISQIYEETNNVFNQLHTSKISKNSVLTCSTQHL
jgi:hypothetical protein